MLRQQRSVLVSEVDLTFSIGASHTCKAKPMHKVASNGGGDFVGRAEVEAI
jgi:hypothetical protein